MLQVKNAKWETWYLSDSTLFQANKSDLLHFSQRITSIAQHFFKRITA